MAIALVEQVGIALEATDQRVIADASGQNVEVGRRSHTQRVIAGAAVQLVAAQPTLNDIVAFSAQDQVVAVPTHDLVIPGGAQRGQLRPDVGRRPLGTVGKHQLLDACRRVLTQRTGQPILQSDRVTAAAKAQHHITSFAQNPHIGGGQAFAQHQRINRVAGVLAGFHDRVVTIALVEQVRIALAAADQRIVADATGQNVLVGKEVNLQRVITRFTVKLIGTAATIDQVIASATANQIVAQPTINDVITIRPQRSHLRPDEFGGPFSSVCKEESLNSSIARLLQAFGQPILQPN